jgi:hypothetical protein
LYDARIDKVNTGGIAAISDPPPRWFTRRSSRANRQHSPR